MNTFQQPQKNKGLALVTGLLLLLVITLIGVSSMRDNVLQERMSRNTIDRAQAFEAAEAALKVGERWVENFTGNTILAVIGIAASDNCSSSVTGTTLVCSPAQYPQTPSATPSATERWENTALWDDSTRHNTYGITDNPTNAKYIIEFLGYLPRIDSASFNRRRSSACSASVSGSTVADRTIWPFCAADDATFRITAIGYGGADGVSRVMLQSVYTK